MSTLDTSTKRDSSQEKFIGAALCAIVSLILFSAYMFVYQSEKSEIIQRFEFRQNAALNQASDRIEAFLGAAERDLAYVANSNLLAEAFSGTTFSVSKWVLLGEQWHDFMLSRKDLYDQLRLIDIQGKERLRVNNTSSGPEVVSADQLQSKADRYYVTEALELDQGTLYMSDFDLNVEAGAIEIPLKPTLRMAAPFSNLEGDKRGIVAINYKGELMLESLRDIGRSWEQEIWLINSDGYWLIGPSPDIEWGFMYPMRAPELIQNRFPDFWKASGVTEAGQTLVVSEGDFSLTGRVLESTVHSNTLFNDIKIHNDNQWTLVSALPLANIDAQLQSLIKSLVPVFIFLEFLLIGLSIWGAKQISLKRIAMRETENREQQFSKMLESAPDATLLSDPNGIITRVNTAALNLFGYTSEELLGHSIDILVPKRIHHSHPVMRSHYLQNPEPRSVTSRNRLTGLHKSGREIPISIALNTVEVSGELRVISAVRDVTAEYEASRELIKLTQRLEIAADASGIGIWEYDARDGSVVWDDRMYRQYSLDKDFDLNIRSWMELIDEEYQDSLRRRIRMAILDSERLDMVIRATNSQGDEIWIRLIATTKLDPDGISQMLVGTQLDVSDEVRVERELRIAYEKTSEANVELEALNQELSESRELAEISAQVKSDFLANMSHEIRTPLNAVLGVNHLLERQVKEASARELIDKQDRAAQSLLSIINDVLDYSKIESGKLDIEQSPFSVMELLDNLTTLVGGQAQAKSLDFIIEPPPREFSSLIGDYLRLEQVLVNLCSNAIKFTEQGQVRLKVTAVKQDGSKINLKFSVSDTGIGISSAVQNRLFDPFSQADASISRRFGGSGLGLSISNRLVTLMGGTLCVDSEINHGSTFSFELILNRQSIDSGRLTEMQDKEVFVAHPSKSVRTGIETALTSFGAHVTTSIFAEELIEQICKESSLQNRSTSLILDAEAYEIPDLEYLLAPLQKIDSKNWPVIALIGNKESLSEADYLEIQGIDLFIQFPVGPLSLYRGLVRARNSESSQCAELVTKEERLSGINLLVVDDNQINLDVAKMMFEEEGARVWLAEGGRQAIRFLRRGDHKVHMVLMDVQMPDIDGLEATRLIKADEKLRNIPILALTAGVTPVQRSAAMEVGMSAFVTKPIDVDRTVLLIRSIANSTIGDQERLIEQEDTVSHSSKQLINETYALRIFKTREKYQRYVLLFLQMYGDAKESIQLLANDPEKLRQMVHKLRGASGHLGLEKISNICADIELLIENQEPLNDQPRLLIDTLDATLELIRQRFSTNDENDSKQVETEGEPADLVSGLKTLYLEINNYNLDRAQIVFANIKSQLTDEYRQELQNALDLFDTNKAKSLLQDMALDINVELN